MLKEMIEKIQVMALAPIREYKFFDRNFVSDKISVVMPPKDPNCPCLSVDTLLGMVDYLKSGFDGGEFGKHGDEAFPLRVALQIESPSVVNAFLPVAGFYKERITVCVAKWNEQVFPFGQFLSQEDFVIKVLARIQDSGDFGSVMELAGKIVCADEAEMMDNGISQAVTVKRGVKQESGRILPVRPVLRPVRTFTEVNQPASEFIFRLRSEPVMLALFEADMGKWELEAKLNIKAFLEAELPGVPVFV
jgi:hypothetical protein